MRRGISKVRDIHITDQSAMSLLRKMKSSGGFTARKLGLAHDIMEEMLEDDDSLNFLSFPADIMATGTRGVIRDMVKEKWFDAIITTCGTLDHDIARSFGDYYEGSFDANDVSLMRRGIHRLGSVFIPRNNYGTLIEKKMTSWLESLSAEGKDELSTSEICQEIGMRLGNDSVL